MKTIINRHKLNHIFEYIISNYETYAPIKENHKVIFAKAKNPSDICLGFYRPIIPFKKFLFPNERKVDDTLVDKKIAILGLNNCDVWALNIFYKELKPFNVLPEKNNLLIGALECKPNENCFCDKFGYNKFADFDFYIQHEDDDFSIFSESKVFEKILKITGIKESKKSPQKREIIVKEEKVNQKLLFQIINNKEENKEFWQGISDNCFGCGACTAVCPLCYCTRQDFKNDLLGNCKQCTNWDTCFSKEFSEIQNHFDIRPQNVDRLYNWYHHKFVRAENENDHFLCTGCGRCIEACPANLNIKNILESIIDKNQ